MTRSLLLPTLALTALLGSALAAADYKEVKNWVSLTDINAQATNQHGDVAISAKGEVYVSTMDPAKGLQVFSQDGKLLRNVPGAPNDFHGFVIHKDKDGMEYIYGPELNAQKILKMTLDGKVVMEIPGTAIPDQYKKVVPPNTKKGKDGKVAKNPDEGKHILRMTGMDVAPNGDLYVTDGYSSSYVYHFDPKGKFIEAFGGTEPPYGFKTLHKIAIDTRFTPARIIGCDRENRRVVHMSLDGKFLGVVKGDMLRPAAVAIQGDYAAIGEIAGQTTILDKQGSVVATFGTNTATDEVASNKLEPVRWRPGFVTAPHGVAFNSHGDVFVSEYNLFGRVHKFVKM